MMAENDHMEAAMCAFVRVCYVHHTPAASLLIGEAVSAHPRGDKQSTDRVVWVGTPAGNEDRLASGAVFTDASAGKILQLPRNELHAVPHQAGQDALTRCGEMAVVLQIAELVRRHRLTRLAVLTDQAATTITRLLERYLDETAKGGPGLRVDVVHVDEGSADTQHESVAVVNNEFSLVGPKGTPTTMYPGCVLLSSHQSALAFATSSVEPLGTIVMAHTWTRGAADTNSENSSVHMAMNTVVVNELVLECVGDCTANIPAALSYLSMDHVDSAMARDC